MSDPLGLACAHGMLARACEVCEMQGEIDSLRRDLEAARAELADRREHMRRGMQSGVSTSPRSRGGER